MAEDSRLEVVLFDTSGEDDVNINETLRAMSEVEAAPQLPAVSDRRSLSAGRHRSSAAPRAVGRVISHALFLSTCRAGMIGGIGL